MIDLVPDAVIGNYRVIRRIGRGGMGAVYEVESRDLHERFALKTFTYDPREDEGDVLKNKFLEEGKILARLHHPKIAHVYSLGYDQDLEQLYFVMDLVLSEDGRPYSVENASFTDLEEETAFAWFVDVCEALDYIHSQGIIHRDIKPGNLLVRQDGHVILTDFGIAKIDAGKLKDEVNPAMTMRIDGNITVLGSNHYMAPEVDKRGEVSPAADAYSLGVMMYEMLTGKWYDQQEDPWSLMDGFRYPWKRALSQLLAENPANRPASYTELAAEMQKWEGEDAPVVFTKRRFVPNLAAPRKKKGLAGPIAFMVFALLLFVGGGFAALYLLDVEEPAKTVPLVAEIPTQRETPPLSPAAETAADEDATSSVTDTSDAAVASSTETKDPAAVTPMPSVETKRADVPAATVEKPEPKKPDYGPLPDVSYVWFADGKKTAPEPVEFMLANGAKVELRPFAPLSDYLMKDAWDMGPFAHRVTFSRPYWISKFCVEPSVLREFEAKSYEDCRELESALKGKYRVYRRISYRAICRFCEFLTDKYRSQLPSGYVFRLPTEAEWDRAIDVEGFKAAAKEEKLDDWRGLTEYTSARLRSEFEAIRRRFELDRFGRWEEGSGQSGFLVEKGILVGGRSAATRNGIVDVAFGHQPLLDCLPTDGELDYAEAEFDPLHRTDGINVEAPSKYWVLARWLTGQRAHMNGNYPFVFHLAVGPDLVKEQAWNYCRVSENSARIELPNLVYEWNPKRILSTLSHPQEMDFRLTGGRTMTFCAIPRGKFRMSNVKGQAAKSHKVELTYSFWMSKYCVTAEQRREYGKYDCEGECRRVEQAFPDQPVYCAFNRKKWEAYCRFLTERYREQLPEGYVFRLPTEAEYEWALVGDDRTEAAEVRSDQNFGDPQIVARSAKRLGKAVGGMDRRGYLASANVCLGGLAEPNARGVHDLWLDNLSQWTCDLYDYDSAAHGSSPERNVFYEEVERDPFHWDGSVARGGLVRSGRTTRALCGFDYESRAHIVLAPDIVTPLVEAEGGPCPETDFGGKLIEGLVLHSLSSERQPETWCTPKRKAQLFSRSPADPGTGGRAFLTAPEDAPWVQIEIPRKMTLAGAVVDSLQDRSMTAGLTVWISDDGERWREIAKADRTLARYRFDFKGKNAVQVRYVRIGREPGRGSGAFTLHKVRLYGRW